MHSHDSYSTHSVNSYSCSSTLNTEVLLDRINSNLYGIGKSISSDTHGNRYIVGVFSQDLFAPYIQLSSQVDELKVYLVSVNSQGKYRWAKALVSYQLETSSDDITVRTVSGSENFLSDIPITLDCVVKKNKIYIAGQIDASFTIYDSGTIPELKLFDVQLTGEAGSQFIIETDLAGKTNWSRVISSIIPNTVPFWSNNYNISVNADKKGNVYLAGNYIGTITFNDNLELPINPIRPKIMDTPFDIMQTDLNKVVSRGYVAKLSKVGDWKWVKDVSSCNPDDSSNLTDIVTLNNGTSYIVGSFEGDLNFHASNYNDMGFLLFSIDHHGHFKRNLTSDRSYGSGISLNEDKLNVVGGFRSSLNIDEFHLSGNKHLNLFIMQLNLDLNINWVKSFPWKPLNLNNDIMKLPEANIVTDYNGNIYVNTLFTKSYTIDGYSLKLKSLIGEAILMLSNDGSLNNIVTINGLSLSSLKLDKDITVNCGKLSLVGGFIDKLSIECNVEYSSIPNVYFIQILK